MSVHKIGLQNIHDTHIKGFYGINFRASYGIPDVPAVEAVQTFKDELRTMAWKTRAHHQVVKTLSLPEGVSCMEGFGKLPHEETKNTDLETRIASKVSNKLELAKNPKKGYKYIFKDEHNPLSGSLNDRYQNQVPESSKYISQILYRDPVTKERLLKEM